MRETLALGLRTNVEKRLHVLELAVDDPEPANPLASSLPLQSEASPANSRRVPPSVSHAFEPRVDLGLKRGRQHVGLEVDARLVRLAAAPLDRLQQLRERLDELTEAVGEQLVGDLAQRDARLLERVERCIAPGTSSSRLARGFP